MLLYFLFAELKKSRIRTSKNTGEIKNSQLYLMWRKMPYLFEYKTTPLINPQFLGNNHLHLPSIYVI